jgi:drug/metabolite transporter (DMT)-like permease
MKDETGSMGLIEWSSLLTLSVFWGGSFFFVGVAVNAIPPLTLVALRVGLAAGALHFIVRLAGIAMPSDRKSWAAFLTMGLLNNMIPFSLIVWGQAHIASGLASILNATTPLFTVVVAHFFTRDEKMTLWRVAGVVAGLVGVSFMMGIEALQGLRTSQVAQLAILMAALSYAFAGVFGRRFRALGVPPLVTATGQLTASSVLMIPLSLIVEQPWSVPMPGVEVWAAVAGLALFSTALAYILYFRILATAGATNVLLVTFLVPVSAILLGTIVLGEQFEGKHFVGMGLIGLGLAAIDARAGRLLRRSVPRNPARVSVDEVS